VGRVEVEVMNLVISESMMHLLVHTSNGLDVIYPQRGHLLEDWFSIWSCRGGVEPLTCGVLWEVGRSLRARPQKGLWEPFPLSCFKTLSVILPCVPELPSSTK
jgi:hypothetical protein